MPIPDKTDTKQSDQGHVHDACDESMGSSCACMTLLQPVVDVMQSASHERDHAEEQLPSSQPALFALIVHDPVTCRCVPDRCSRRMDSCFLMTEPFCM